ncbi:MAG: hypothetical protein IH571_02365 [Acholeplasmataceae bacterium]|nr:hypothetical protein [Acholeplasmataceae bacterium]
MEKVKFGYGWLLKFLLAAILLGVGIYMVFADEIVYLITGVAIVIFSVFRVVPLLKSLNKEVLRTINLIEIIFDTLIGAILIYIALSDKNLANEPIWSGIYRFSLAIFFIGRGLVFFNSVVFLGEKTEVVKFWVHIIALSLGVYIASRPDFGFETVGVFLLIVSLLGASYLGFDGYKGYKKYREFSKDLNTEKRKAEEEKIKKDLPKPIGDEAEDERPYVS